MPEVGDRVRFRLFTTEEAAGVVTHRPTKTADGRDIIWAEVDDGPEWAIGETFSLLAGEVLDD